MTEHILDHEARALARMLQQDKGKAKLEGFIAACVSPIQAVEDALWQLLVERGVDVAVGAQLEVIGFLVGQDRNGQLDADYRRFVKAKISVNKSRGLMNELIAITKLVLDNPSVTIVMRPEYPASLTIHLSGVELSAATISTLMTFLRKTIAGGVRLLVHFHTATAANTFAFLDDATGLGLGSTADAGIGGTFSNVTE